MEPDPDPPLDVTRTSTPKPFRASTAEEIKRGTITLTFTKPADSPDVACEGITVILPRGEEETDLVNDDERADSTLIDDYARDSTGATWTVRRIPPAPEAAAPDWGETPGREFQNIFDPRDDRYYQTQGRVPKNTALTVDYGTVQEIDSIDIATGLPDQRFKVQMLWLQSSLDGEFWSNIGTEVLDTSHIERRFDTPLRARYLRIETIVDPSNEAYAVVRRFLINTGAQHRSEDSTVSFICTPDSRTALFDQDREFTLILANVPINQAPGAAALAIVETIADGDTVEDHTSILRGFEKIGTDFVFENFSSRQPRVENGCGTTLHWTGSPHNTNYFISWDDREPEMLSGVTGPDCQWPTPELTHTTTFVLRAETPNAAGESIRRYLSTTVTVKEPSIDARRLTATDLAAVADGDAVTFQTRTEDRKTIADKAVFNAEVTIT